MISLDANVKKRYNAFWDGEAFERCCLFLTSPNPQYTPNPPPASLQQQWEDIDFRVQCECNNVANTIYHADAFPGVFINFGPGCFASCIGGTHQWSNGTVWFENEQIITDWSHPPVPRIHWEGTMCRLVEEFTGKMMQAGEGKLLASITDIGGTFDILASLRGTQQLLVDLYEYPEEVKQYVKQIQPLWLEYFEKLSGWLLRTQGAMTSWIPAYSEQAYYTLQCDFSAMISPAMFEEFVLPDLRFQTESMPRSIYHLDGQGELPHLDMLLSLPELNAIQWIPTPESGDLADEKWFDLYQRIQHAHKGLILLGVPPEKVEFLLKHISTKGLLIATSVWEDKAAKELIALVDSFGVK